AVRDSGLGAGVRRRRPGCGRRPWPFGGRRRGSRGAPGAASGRRRGGRTPRLGLREAGWGYLEGRPGRGTGRPAGGATRRDRRTEGFAVRAGEPRPFELAADLVGATMRLPDPAPVQDGA